MHTKIYVMGDLHADWNSLNTFINEKKPDIILQCGEFGLWPRMGDELSVNNINNKNTKIYWCEGNHEDYYAIQELIDGEAKLPTNITYMKRGSVLTLPDGRKVMFFGGAWSVDNQWRTDGINWFKEEELLKEKDIQNIYNYKEGEIDLVISHTAPNEFVIGIYGNENYDPSRRVLSHVLEVIKPKQWVFAHWHLYKSEYYTYSNGNMCLWTCLDKSSSIKNWWKKYDEIL
jgi:hypothetical protein